MFGCWAGRALRVTWLNLLIKEEETEGLGVGGGRLPEADMLANGLVGQDVPFPVSGDPGPASQVETAGGRGPCWGASFPPSTYVSFQNESGKVTSTVTNLFPGLLQPYIYK